MPNLSIWEKESFYAPQDIIIVGAGLMGLWSAWELINNNKKLKITIVERGTTPLGASTRNAGFACFGSPTELIHDAEILGTDDMLATVEMRYKGIEKIKKTLSQSQIDFDACGGYECINKADKHWEGLEDKIQWLNTLLRKITGDEQSFTYQNSLLQSMGLQGFDSLIKNSSEAALHSGKLVHSLSQLLQSSGIQILYGIEIKSWETKLRKITLTSNQNFTLTTKQLLFCTNAYTQLLVPEVAVTPARGQVIVTSPIPGLTLKGTFHYNEGFYYWRNLGNRILLGGARNRAIKDEETTDLGGSTKIKLALEQFLKEHLTTNFKYTIEHHWSGIMGFTTNKKPFVGQVEENVFVAVACNGMGVALTPIIAEEVSKKMLSDF